MGGGGGGEAGEVQKKIVAQGKIKWKKNHARELTLKNIYAIQVFAAPRDSNTIFCTNSQTLYTVV